VGGGDFAIRPGAGVRQSRDRWHRRAAADRDHDRLARDQHLVTHADPALAVQTAVAAHQLDVARLEPRHLVSVVEPVDDLVAAAQRRADVDLAADDLRGARHACRLGEDLLGAQQRLRGHAGVEGAFAADEVALDDGDPLAAPLGHAAGGDLAGRAGADDNYVELAFHPSLQARVVGEACRVCIPLDMPQPEKDSAGAGEGRSGRPGAGAAGDAAQW
jgi:hypothetical protein